MTETRHSLRWLIWVGLCLVFYLFLFGTLVLDSQVSGRSMFALWVLFFLTSLWVVLRVERRFGHRRLAIAGLLIGVHLLVGVLAQVAIANSFGAIDRGRQKRSMADVRRIGTEVERYSVLHRSYPEAGDVAQLEEVLGVGLPVRDGWGNDLVYSKNPGEERYLVICLGRDGKPDPRGQGDFRGQTSRFEDDIIMQNGQFVQWPEGSQR